MVCPWPRLCIWTWKFLGISADYNENLNTVLVWTPWLCFHCLSPRGFFPIPWVSAGFVGWAALPVTVMFVSVILWESHWGSPGLFPPLVKHPPSSSVSHIQEMFLCCAGSAAPLLPSLGWGRSRDLSPEHSRAFPSFPTHSVAWFDMITVLSVRKRIYLVSVPPVCVHGHDAFSFPVCITLAHSGHFWPILGLVFGWAGLDNHLSLRERNIMVLYFLSSPILAPVFLQHIAGLSSRVHAEHEHFHFLIFDSRAFWTSCICLKALCQLQLLVWLLP